MDLTDRERLVLDVARETWGMRPNPRAQVVWERLECSEPAWRFELNVLLDTERALAAEPILVRRLLARRDRLRRRVA